MKSRLHERTERTEDQTRLQNTELRRVNSDSIPNQVSKTLSDRCCQLQLPPPPHFRFCQFGARNGGIQMGP